MVQKVLYLKTFMFKCFWKIFLISHAVNLYTICCVGGYSGWWLHCVAKQACKIGFEIQYKAALKCWWENTKCILLRWESCFITIYFCLRRHGISCVCTKPVEVEVDKTAITWNCMTCKMQNKHLQRHDTTKIFKSM